MRKHSRAFIRYRVELRLAENDESKIAILHHMEQEGDVTFDEAQELYDIAFPENK